MTTSSGSSNVSIDTLSETTVESHNKTSQLILRIVTLNDNFCLESTVHKWLRILQRVDTLSDNFCWESTWVVTSSKG